jgi:hypothetical protein
MTTDGMSAATTGCRMDLMNSTAGETHSIHHTEAVLCGLQRTAMFALAVEVYRQHRCDGGGRCRLCRAAICRARRHAATIILAAGVDLSDIDTAVRCEVWRRGVPLRLRHSRQARRPMAGSPPCRPAGRT